MFRALLPHLHEALHKINLVYCVRVMSVGCTRIEAPFCIIIIIIIITEMDPAYHVAYVALKQNLGVNQRRLSPHTERFLDTLLHKRPTG
jgi:hypothetical protein